MLKSIRNGCRRLAIPFQCWASPFRCGRCYTKRSHVVKHLL
uniref:C2H2-type domain-containing protein n=1 Tax=Salmonella phage vB_STmST19_KE05 TaxID=3161163 RepID=A0AAU8GG01_9CAUD